MVLSVRAVQDLYLDIKRNVLTNVLQGVIWETQLMQRVQCVLIIAEFVQVRHRVIFVIGDLH